MAFTFPPKPWTDGQLFETESANGTSLIGIYNASKNLWSFERTTESGASSLITTRDVRTLKTRPAVIPNPFDPNLDDFANQQETNWFLWDGIQNVLVTSTATPEASSYNSFWFNETEKVLYVWDIDQWIRAAPDADIFEGFTVDAAGGSANTSGSITIKAKSGLTNSGCLFLQGSGGSTNLACYPTGSIQTNGVITSNVSNGDAFVVGNGKYRVDYTGNVEQGKSLSFTGTSADKIISGYNNSNSAFVFKLGTNSSTATERLKITTLGTIIQGGLDVEGINGQYAAQFKGDIFLDQPSTSINVFGESNANLEIYVGEEAASTSRQIAVYEGNLFLFGDVTCETTLNTTGRFTASGGITTTGSASNTIAGGTTFTGAFAANSTSVFRGNTTFNTNAIFANALQFTQPGSQIADISNKLLFYGLKADGTRPSWEAIQLGNDPNNENFSAMTIGKRMYYSGGYIYMDGSVRTYVGTSTWDYRDNDTNNNVLWSVNASGVTYQTSLTVPEPTAVTHAATVNYVDTEIDAFKASLYTAVYDSTDYASLKTALLAALQ